MITYQLNKTALGELGKQLKMREKALPTIKSKESALRLEVKKAKDEAARLDKLIVKTKKQWDYMAQLWGEFDTSLLGVKNLKVSNTKIAGVMIPILDSVEFEYKEYDLFSAPMWISDGVEILEKLSRLSIEREFFLKKMDILDYTRKKTTQKVNLYEKVQIPEYQAAILKIKRFLEDEENLSKAAQKIVKLRLETMQDQNSENEKEFSSELVANQSNNNIKTQEVTL